MSIGFNSLCLLISIPTYYFSIKHLGWKDTIIISIVAVVGGIILMAPFII